jgi:hypothetical protein
MLKMTEEASSQSDEHPENPNPEEPSSEDGTDPVNTLICARPAKPEHGDDETPGCDY